MAVVITGQNFYEGILAGSSSSNYSLFNIGEAILVYTDVEFFTQVSFPASSPLLTGNTANQNHLYRSGGFANVSVGDTLRIIDSAGGSFFNTTNNQIVTVLVKYSNNEVKVSNPVSAPGTPLPNSQSYNTTIVMYNLTEIKSMEYQYNFIENNQAFTYLNLATNQVQSYKASNIHLSSLGSPSLLVAQGGPEWQINASWLANSDVYRVSYDTSNGRQVFRVRHATIVTPLFLPSQLTDTLNGIAPAYNISGNCLKYICKIGGLRSINDPNSLQSIETNPNILGNEGWFNESFNGGAQNYFIQNVVYSDLTGPITNLNPYLPYGQTIQFDIYSPDGDFAAGQRISIGGMKLPNNTSEFQNNGRTMSENYLFANIYGYANGLNYTNPYGTNYNFIEKWSAIVSSANTIKVVIYVVFDPSTTLGVVTESAIPRFCFWSTLANPSFTDVNLFNKQVIWDGVKDFSTSVRPADTGIIQTFKRHYEDDSSDGITGLITTFKNDECVMVSNIYGTWRETPSNTDEINLTNLSQQVVAKRISDGAEFLLEDFQLPTNVVYQSGVPVFNYSNNRVFQIPSTEIRKAITIEVVTIGSSNYQFKINYPFMIRWENWVQLIGANSDFYNPSQLNNGLNQDWEHYLTSDWEIYFRTGYDVVSSVGPYHFEKDLLIPINDYATNPDYITKKVESFTTGGTQLLSTGVNYIQAAQNTVIKATFEKTGGLDKDDCRVVFGIEIRQQGGIGGRVRYSSVWETANPLTWFVPFSGSINKVLISQITSDKVEAKATLDHTLLPQGNITYTIVARLYEVPAPIKPGDYKRMEDGVYKLMEDGTQKIME